MNKKERKRDRKRGEREYEQQRKKKKREMRSEEIKKHNQTLDLDHDAIAFCKSLTKYSFIVY